MIALRSFETGVVQILPGTENATLPFWSPDSHHLAFVALGRLERYALTTGTVQVVADVSLNFEGGTWNRGGTILYGSANDGLFKVPAQGGPPERVTTLNAPGEVSHRWPVFMPDGRHYVFVVQSPNRIRFGTLGSQEAKDLIPTDGRAAYSASGHLIYGLQGVLHARRFDPASGELSGEAMPVAENVRMLGTNARATYTVSDTGVLVYRTGSARATQSRLQWYDRSGKALTEALPYGEYRSVSLAPDASRIAFHRHDTPDGGGIWMKDLTRGTVTRVTFNSHSFDEVWHPDGRRIAFAVTPTAGNFGAPATGSLSEIAMTSANGTGDVERLVTSKDANLWPNWSPDGKVLLYQSGGTGATKTDIWVMPMETRKPVPYIHGAANEAHPAFSPDGKWVAYTSDETGRPEIYVQPYPANGDKWTISTSGGVQAQWRADGKELFFLTPTQNPQKMYAVDVSVKGDRFNAGIPQVLFATRALLLTGPMSPYRCYAVAPDGQSLLITEVASDANQPNQPREPLTVILNWTALLRR